MDSPSTANTCLELHIGIGKHCHKPVTQKSTQSRLLKIKPHMFRRIMAMNELHSQEESVCSKASKLSCNIKILELFPQHKTFADSSIPAKAKVSKSSVEDDMLVKESVDVTHLQPPAEQSKSQITIFYKGAVNVFDVSADKAEFIMMMAAGNSLQQTSVFYGPSSATSNALSLCGSLLKNNSSTARSSSVPPQTSEAKLPIGKKLSLQRFLQKRKDRMKRQMPYPVNAN